MKSFLKNCVFFLLAAIPVFSQSGSREQGLVTSEPFWRQALGGEVLSLPSVQAQSAVVALDGGNIRAYSTTGNPLWNYSARGKISPFVTRSREGTSYFSRTNGSLIAVNRSGRELWQRNLGSPLCARVVTGWDGRLFVPVDKKIFCYTASGNLLWTKIFESSFSIAPKLDRGGGITFALDNNEVCSMDPFGAIHIWRLSKKPAVLVSIAQQQIIVLYGDGTMEMLDISKDTNLSAQRENNSNDFPKLPSNPLAAIGRGGNLAITMSDGRIAFVSTEEKKIMWFGDSHIGSRSETEVEMLFDERGIFILSMSGASGFNIDGRRLWLTTIQNAAALPAFGNDGVLYSGGRDWILYSYKMEDRILPEKNALYGPVPEGSYGMGRPRIFNTHDIPVNENDKRIKLAQITREIISGRVGVNEPAWTSFLLLTSAGKDPIQLRLDAISLLGKIGSQETIPWLTNIFRNEKEPIIRIMALLAIGDIGVDPQGIAIQTFLHSIISDGSVKDERILTAMAKATGSLCRFSGPPLSKAGIQILTMLIAPYQPSGTRKQARWELASLL